MLGSAVILSALTAMLLHPILSAHERVCRWLLGVSRIPVTGWQSYWLFPEFGDALLPDVPTPLHSEGITGWITVFGISLLVFFALHRFFPLARNFVLYLVGLLVSAAAVIVLLPSFRVDAVSFGFTWLRTELVFWIVLPYLTSFLILPVQPSAITGIGWVLVIQFYGFIWSAIRFAMCLAILHYTGILYVTLLWFSLGPLSDLLYVLVFYSISVSLACRKMWGLRGA